MCKCTPSLRTPFCGKPNCAYPKQEAPSPVGGFTPPAKIPSKWTVEEFWKSLYWEVLDSDDNYDGYLHICTNINGTEIKIPIKDIIHAVSSERNKL